MKLVLGVAAATSLFSAAPVLAATDCTLDAVKALGVGDLTLSEAAADRERRQALCDLIRAPAAQ